MLVWNRHYGFVDFGGMDGGVLVQAAWAVYHGSIPYQDIPSAMPPLFFIGAGGAFDLLGPSWSSLNWLLDAFALVSFGWSFSLLAEITRRPWLSLFFAVAFQAVTLMPLSWWWYNELASTVAVLALLSGYGLTQVPGRLFFRISWGCAFALLLLVKMNTAIVLACMLGAVLFLQRKTRKAAALGVILALMGDCLLLSCSHISVPLYLHNCGQFSSRLTSWDALDWDLLSAAPTEHYTSLKILCYLLLICIPVIYFDRDLSRRRVHTIWLYMIVAIALVQAFTNNDLKLKETVFPLLLASLILGVRTEPPSFLFGFASFLIFAFGALLIFMGLALGITRVSVMMIGPHFYAGNEPPEHVLKEPPFFRGLRVETRLLSVLQEVKAVVTTTTDSKTTPRIFFGPRLDFCYAAYGLPFPKGLPIWWEKIPSSHVGRQYPMGIVMPGFLTSPSRWLAEGAPVDYRVQRFIDDKFDLCIFVRGYQKIADMTFFPDNLRGYIYEHYRKVDFPDIVVFERNQP